MKKIQKEKVIDLIRLALNEDIGNGDITTNALVPSDTQTTGRFVTRQKGVLAGIDLVKWVFEEIDSNILLDIKIEDGSILYPGDILAEIKGPASSILIGERTALNFIQRASGIASYTKKCCDEVKGTNVKILDTRKTLPGYRIIDKYSVLAGGGHNHRMGLYDQFLIKDNHLASFDGNIIEAVTRSRDFADAPVEIEVENFEQLKLALKAKADIILLDNMSPQEMTKAVKIARDESSGDYKPELEASGGISFETLRTVAECGVDRISIGRLTHSVEALDIALEFD